MKKEIITLMLSIALTLGPTAGGDSSAEKPPVATPDVSQSVQLHRQQTEVVRLTNAARQEAGLSVLTEDSQLTRLAQQKAEDMAANHYFSHTSPTYGTAFDMMQAAGISYHSAGENIAKGQKTAEAVMKGWMNSAGHRANILKDDYTRLGVGYALDQNGTAYWVQIFAG